MDNIQPRASGNIPRCQALLIFPARNQFHYSNRSPSNCQCCCQHRPRDIPREVRHLHYLTAMHPNWQHITGLNNVTADALSHATAAKQSTAAATLIPMATDSHSKVSTLFFINVPDQDNNEYKPTINSMTNTLKNRQYKALIAHQKNETELKQLVKNSDSAVANNKLKLLNNLFCIEENNNLRIYVPHPLRNILLHDPHDTAHPGVRNTLREAQQRYYWPFRHRDVTDWTKACPHCQAAKI